MKDPEILITQYAYDKICAYIDHATGEVSGFGTVDETKSVAGLTFTISDVFILPQDTSGAHATISPKAYAGFITERLKAKQDIKTVRLWWHSHAEISSFFSGIDTATIADATEFPLLVSIVGNKRKEFTQRIDIFSPWHSTCSPDKLWIVNTPRKFTPAENEACEKEVAEKVKHPKQSKTAPWIEQRRYATPARSFTGEPSYEPIGTDDIVNIDVPPYEHREADSDYFKRLAKEQKKRARGMWDFIGY